jgi:hypothetical protein
LNLNDQREAVDAALDTAITIALIDHLRTDALDSAEDVLHELSTRGYDLRNQLSVGATDRDEDFLQHLREKFQIQARFVPRELLLIEWEEGTWSDLRQALQDEGVEFPPGIGKDLRELLKRCLDEGSLAPLEEDHHRKLDERQRRIRDLERGLEKRTLSFNPEELLGKSARPGTVSGAGTSEPGQGSGGGRVTSDQAVRGRVAEMFVLHACWVRFLEYDEDCRRQILEAVRSRRRGGSGGSHDHVDWSTKTAWKDLKERLERHQEDLIACCKDDADGHRRLTKVFKDLIEVANEHGPGYDVLDPLGVWGNTQEDARSHPDPRRVEIKAVLRDANDDTAYRIVLTTNEFHRACRDPESYVLRLISVPGEPEERLDQVRWICDIPNPVQTLNLREQIGKGVRGGMLPLTVEFRGRDRH